MNLNNNIDNDKQFGFAAGEELPQPVVKLSKFDLIAWFIKLLTHGE